MLEDGGAYPGGTESVKAGLLTKHPLGAVQLLRKPNVRRMVVDEAGFQRLFAAAEETLRAVLLLAFDTGTRKEELLALRWEQVDLDAGTIQLTSEDTKTEEARLIVLTDRSRTALRALPSRFGRQFVFVNSKTGTRWLDIRKSFKGSVAGAGLHGLWFHDLRRSFVTRARRVGVPESVVMRMSGHRTRAVFETARWVRAASRSTARGGHPGVSAPRNTKAPT